MKACVKEQHVQNKISDWQLSVATNKTCWVDRCTAISGTKRSRFMEAPIMLAVKHLFGTRPALMSNFFHEIGTMYQTNRTIIY